MERSAGTHEGWMAEGQGTGWKRTKSVWVLVEGNRYDVEEWEPDDPRLKELR